MTRLLTILCVLLASVQAFAFPGGAGAVRSDELLQFLQQVEREPSRQGEPVTVILEYAGTPPPGLLAAHGAQLRLQRDRLNEVVLPRGRLAGLLAALPDGVLARFPYPHQALGMITSQGVVLTGGDDMHILGHTGLGLTIGVIDLGFTGLAAAQSAGELPANLVIQDYTGTGTGGTDHGTNVAEIVHDMAPDASLHMAKISTEVQLGQAMEDMVAAGVDVIVHSVAWFGAAYYDGTGPICSITDTATDAGVLWVNAMGNHRLKHYAATFTDTVADGRHQFQPGRGYNSISLNQGASVSLVLNWDAYPSTTVDYDLYLYNGIPGQGGQVVAASTNRQSGRGPSRYPYPVEILEYVAPAAATYYIVVSKVDSSVPNLPFTLFSLGPNLDMRTPAGSILQPADCHDVLAVGATNLTDGPESFSSEGPTKDGRPKPEIAAPNRVSTSRTTSFAGTSAAAPHAAGALALLKTQNTEFDNTALVGLLTNTAHDVHVAGFDARTGHGRISLDADQDGLSRDQELLYGTDPLSADSDGDGLTDWEEIFVYGTDPLNPDTSGNGFSDGVEVLYDSDPLNPDQIPDLVFGDLNGDGVVDVADMVLMRRFVLGLSEPTPEQKLHGDVAPLVDGRPRPDGILDIGDLLLLQREALGLGVLERL